MVTPAQVSALAALWPIILVRRSPDRKMWQVRGKVAGGRSVVLASFHHRWAADELRESIEDSAMRSLFQAAMGAEGEAPPVRVTQKEKRRRGAG